MNTFKSPFATPDAQEFETSHVTPKKPRKSTLNRAGTLAELREALDDVAEMYVTRSDSITQSKFKREAGEAWERNKSRFFHETPRKRPAETPLDDMRKPFSREPPIEFLEPRHMHMHLRLPSPTTTELTSHQQSP